LCECCRGTIDGMLAEAPGLLQIEEVGALYTLIFRVVHWPSPNHSLRRGWCFPLSVAVPAAALPGGRLRRPLAYGVRSAGTCGCRCPDRLAVECPCVPGRADARHCGPTRSLALGSGNSRIRQLAIAVADALAGYGENRQAGGPG